MKLLPLFLGGVVSISFSILWLLFIEFVHEDGATIELFTVPFVAVLGGVLGFLLVHFIEIRKRKLSLGHLNKTVIDGVLFIWIGFNIVWFWVQTNLLVVSHGHDDNGELWVSTLADRIKFWFDLSPLMQSIICISMALFFISWGIWTALKKIEPAHGPYGENVH